MAASNLFVLIDDIATLLDDVAGMTKIAAKKTAGVLGDDLALNAQQVTGVKPDRELPVVWAVAKGSFINKLILVPAALLISQFAPWAITPMLMLGGAFLCYEGFEKVAHKFLHSKHDDETHHAELVNALADPKVDMVEFEKNKIKGAIRTDFILSAEIIVLTLGVAAEADLMGRLLVLSIVAIAITAGVYGLVAGIVKIDDAGLYLSQREGESLSARLRRKFGRFLLAAAPKFMKTLSVVGTAAMFLVGGGILLHGLPWGHDVLHWLEHAAEQIAGIGGILKAITPTLTNGVAGLIAGAILVPIVAMGSKAYAAIRPAGSHAEH